MDRPVAACGGEVAGWRRRDPVAPTRGWGDLDRCARSGDGSRECPHRWAGGGTPASSAHPSVGLPLPNRNPPGSRFGRSGASREAFVAVSRRPQLHDMTIVRRGPCDRHEDGMRPVTGPRSPGSSGPAWPSAFVAACVGGVRAAGRTGGHGSTSDRHGPAACGRRRGRGRCRAGADTWWCPSGTRSLAARELVGWDRRDHGRGRVRNRRVPAGPCGPGSSADGSSGGDEELDAGRARGATGDGRDEDGLDHRGHLLRARRSRNSDGAGSHRPAASGYR